MTAKDFARLLVRLNACEEAREWAEGHTLEWSWNNCPRGVWLKRLADKLRVELTAPACAEYERVTAPAWAEYKRARANAVRRAIPFKQIAKAARGFKS